MSVELHIGRLVLDGFGPVSGRRVAAVAERHLAALVQRHGLPAVARHDGAEGMVAPEIRLARDAGAGEIGRAVAASIYRGLAR